MTVNETAGGISPDRNRVGFCGMVENGVVDTEMRLRRRRTKRKSKNHTIRKRLYELRWVFAGVALGLPLLALLIFMASL